MRTIWHVYHSTRGCAGDYIHALVLASEQGGGRCRAFVSARYVFNTPHVVRLFFPVTERIKNRGGRFRLGRGVELATGYGLILVWALFARPVINLNLTDSLWVTYAFFRLCKLARLKTAVTCHDVIEHSGELPERRRRILQGADKLIVHSAAAARMLAATIAPEPGRVARYPFPSASSRPILREPERTQAEREVGELTGGRRTFLLIGYVRPDKGAGLLSEAWRLLCQAGPPEAQLLIVGQWDKACLGLKEKFAGLPNVTIQDRRVSDEEFIVLIRSAYYVMLPYGNYAHSGVLFTCANEAAPVILSDVELFADLIPGYGFRFKQGDAADLARVMRQALGAPEAARRQASAQLTALVQAIAAELPGRLRACFSAL
jgi:glycosyltransferase involved in cell wall biosynthesis